MPKKADEIYRYIINYKARHDGCAPDHRTIAKACEVSSTSEVHRHLRILERGGLIRLGDDRTARQIIVTGARWCPPE